MKKAGKRLFSIPYPLFSKLGFTLIELLVVIAITALLTATGVVSFASVGKKSRNARRESDIGQVMSALEMYRTDNKEYPASASVVFNGTGTIADGTRTYMDPVPMDPKCPDAACTGYTNYTYSLVTSATYTLTFYEETGTGSIVKTRHQP